MINKKFNIDFSIVTIVNNFEVYHEFCDNLSNQEDIEYELVPIYNLNSEYKSARKAYNSVLDKCNGKYIIFTHPDIRFQTKRELSLIKKYVDDIDSFGVIGSAGAYYDDHDLNKRTIYSSMLHGINKINAGIEIQGVKEVQTVDECFFITEREYILSNRFSETDGWHLYAVELCLESILQKRMNFVIPVNMWHISDGKSFDVNYIYQLERLIKVYGDYFPIIYTTVKMWKTKGVCSKIYRRYYIVKQKIKRIIMG